MTQITKEDIKQAKIENPKLFNYIIGQLFVFKGTEMNNQEAQEEYAKVLTTRIIKKINQFD